MWLIGEPARRRDRSRRESRGEQRPSVLDPQVGLERVRGHAVLLTEAPDQLESTQPGDGRELGQRDPLIPPLG